MKQKVPKAEIVRTVRTINRRLTRIYNNYVDTNYSVQGKKIEKSPLKLKESSEKNNEDDLDIELYTTLHRVAAQDIHDMIKEYL